MSGCYQNIASNYQCLVSPFSRISRIMLIRKVRVPFSESQFLFWKLLVIDVTFDSDQLYYEHILLVVRRTGWEHAPDEQISNRRFSTLDAPEPGVPHLCIYPTLNQRYLERKKNVRKFQKFAALWQPFPRCLYHIHNNFCSTYIILVVISNLEMMKSKEDVHRLYANSTLFYIKDLIIVDLGISQGPETNPLKYQGTYVP